MEVVRARWGRTLGGKDGGVGYYGLDTRQEMGCQTGMGLQTGVGFQSWDGIPDIGGVPDMDCVVRDKDGGVPDR